MHVDPKLPIDQLPVSNSSAHWGYQLVDEPSAAEFPQLQADVNNFSKSRPGKLVFINLLPNYAPPSMLGAATYGDYVNTCVGGHNMFVCCDMMTA